MKTTFIRNLSIALVASTSLFLGGCASGSKGTCPASKCTVAQKCSPDSKACCPTGQQCPVTKKAASKTR